MTWNAGEPRWYTMTITRKQWERWDRKAKYYEEQKRLRGPDYWRDIDPTEDLRGSQIAAIVDALAVQIELRYPNPVTRVLVDSMQLFEKVTRQLPIELRDDAGAFLSERLRDTTVRPDRQPDPFALEDEKRNSRRLEREERPLLEELRPRLSLKLNPRLSDLEEPSVKAGAGFSLRLLSDRCRFKAEGDYDTKDGDWSCGGFLSFDF